MAFLTPRAVATRTGLSVSALHFYEREGLIAAHRTAGNQRRYERSVLRRLALVKAAQALGIPLSEVKRQLAPLPVDRPPSQDDWEQVAEAWREGLTARIEKMTRLRDYLSGCIGCGCLSMAKCPLYNPDDKLAAKGSGAVAVDQKI
ncbi:MAG: redox-sensitive transcriptional activator SoxR [Parvularcula sp.]|nr:redox-sensitive transcriptional activator SoxR [Parvularcula sp.]